MVESYSSTLTVQKIKNPSSDGMVTPSSPTSTIKIEISIRTLREMVAAYPDQHRIDDVSQEVRAEIEAFKANLDREEKGDASLAPLISLYRQAHATYEEGAKKVYQALKADEPEGATRLINEDVSSALVEISQCQEKYFEMSKKNTKRPAWIEKNMPHGPRASSARPSTHHVTFDLTPYIGNAWWIVAAIVILVAYFIRH